MKRWLFKLLYPHSDAAKEIGALRREYERKLASAYHQTPLDQSVWVRRFTALEADYNALEREMTELRVQNAVLKSQLLQKLIT